MQFKLIGLSCLLIYLPIQLAAPNLAGGQDNQSPAPSRWTILIYAGVDSSAESHVMPHLEQLASESKLGQSAEILLFIDRSPRNSDNATILGEDFSDSRLFRLNDGTWRRIAGGKEFPEITLESKYEANSGDAKTLAKFIKCGKTISPTKNYALILFGHGHCRSLCPDESVANKQLNERDDPIYTAEITDCLTDKESVDLLWVDACTFGGIENAYQFRRKNGRFSAKMMLASPPSSSPAPMAKILTDAGFMGSSIQTQTRPSDGVAFGKTAIASIRAYYEKKRFQGYREAWSLYDVEASVKVKQAADRLAASLAKTDTKTIVENIRGAEKKPVTLNYMRYRKDTALMWVVAPHFDLYDLADRLSNHADLPKTVRHNAAALKSAVDTLIVDSFAGTMYKKFQPGKHGIFIVFPDGDAMWRDKPQWAAFQWYHPNKRVGLRYAYGNYDWCDDAANPGNGAVENWFELLDYWFDAHDTAGGHNSYKY